MRETWNRRPVDSERDSLPFRALSWTQAIARPVSLRDSTATFKFLAVLISIISFATILQILWVMPSTRASLSFFTSKYAHTGLRFDCFMLVCFFFPLHVGMDACAVSEPFGVGVVASRALVQAGETLNQHYISSPEYSLAKEQVSIHWKSFNLIE